MSLEFEDEQGKLNNRAIYQHSSYGGIIGFIIKSGLANTEASATKLLKATFFVSIAVTAILSWYLFLKPGSTTPTQEMLSNRESNEMEFAKWQQYNLKK